MNSSSSKDDLVAGGFKRWGATRLLGIVLAGALLTGSNLTAAQVMVFDRGLPTANLNNAAGANRSNVAWADSEAVADPVYLPGDDFTLPGSGPYIVNTIRVWSLDSTGLSLWGGVAGDPITQQSTAYTATAVTYSNAEDYQGGGGAFSTIYQIDFTVFTPLNAGDTYQFFLDGGAISSGSSVRSAYLHASNATFSGSTQAGADNTFLFLDPDGNVTTWNSATGAGTYCPGCVGWDKDSDGNVQVFALTTEKECKQYVDQQKKDFEAQQKADKKAFELTGPTKAEKKAFDDQQKAAKKAYDDAHKGDKKACDQLPK